ncbi:protein transporter Sec31 [Streptomyces sp. SID5910]|uniref:protein transporter Sec31 n=1 Tax=Streptomyces sp. SID5910 TaxID=2690312 RepID=UPI00136C512D|nr:protein transporter Sec31 [Streptomyces sp. SID5910]MYR45066.1 protein transporter Sec31 [Streptomyces sp. SID5910]
MKTDRIERKRLVPHTVDGVTELVLDTEYIDVPAPPRDWDSIVRVGVTTIAGTLVTVSLVWTTASIGDLLSMATIAVVAYAAGVAFDLTWILCMGVEWLLRYEPERAAPVRRAGNVALLISMGAVFAHGQLFGMWPVGAAGAAVSLLAKRSWSTAMRVHARPLDNRTAQWVAKQRAALDGQLAMIPVRRELLRGEQMVEADRIARTTGSADPDPSGEPADRPGPAVDRKSLTTKDAVRIAWSEGIRDRDAVLQDAAARLGRPVSPDSVDRYLRDLKRGA